jgi:hypothetical protein
VDVVVVVRIVGSPGPSTLQMLSHAEVPTPTDPEAFAVVGEVDPRERLTVCGAEVRGLVYEVLEIADA